MKLISSKEQERVQAVTNRHQLTIISYLGKHSANCLHIYHVQSYVKKIKYNLN